MVAPSHASDLARELTVVYADLPGQALAEECGPILDLTYLLWPGRVCDAAIDFRLIIHREMIDVVQRNLNASLSLLRRLAGARNPGEIVELQQLTSAISSQPQVKDAYPAHSWISCQTQRRLTIKWQPSLSGGFVGRLPQITPDPNASGADSLLVPRVRTTDPQQKRVRGTAMRSAKVRFVP